MKILVACEYSQRVTNAFRQLGHNAFSCDLLPAKSPSYHYQGPVQDLLHITWDLIIAFPPCTHLSLSGARWYSQKQSLQAEAIRFFLSFASHPCPKVAIENPVGIMSRIYRKPDQIVHPYMFGDPFSKRTCLWLKNLPLLTPTKLVSKGPTQLLSSGATIQSWYSRLSKSKRQAARSITSQGLAHAMASQWSNL